MSTTLYGIPNCDTVKKARTWLTEQGIAHEFHDFRKHGISETLLRTWLKQVPSDVLVNRRGTTWRALDDAARLAADTEDGALALMLRQPSVIKRPVVEHDGKVSVGFSAADFAERFQ